jgi:hypothetical protein
MSTEKTGTVTARGVSKNGKPTITLDGSLYYAGGTDLTGLAIGDRIQFSATSFADGKLWGIDKGWKLIEHAPEAQKYPPSTHAQGPTAAYQGQGPLTAGLAVNAAPATSGAGLLAVTDVERPCVSNWGAELIKAGVVKEPADLGIWVNAALHALRGT